jgi:hypothetical protein
MCGLWLVRRSNFKAEAPTNLSFAQRTAIIAGASVEAIGSKNDDTQESRESAE